MAWKIGVGKYEGRKTRFFESKRMFLVAWQELFVEVQARPELFHSKSLICLCSVAMAWEHRGDEWVRLAVIKVRRNYKQEYTAEMVEESE